MTDRWLACRRCGSEFDLGAYFFGCPRCADDDAVATLEVHYDLPAARRALDERLRDGERVDLWRFAPLLPLRDPAHAVSLGEGGTPLVAIRRLNEAIGLPNLLLKNESQNPTWSYKDRFNSVAISVARELGFAKIASSSTGNHGASAAAYAAAAGMRCVVLLPDETPELLRDLILAYGAQAIVTRWQARGAFLEALIRDHGWFPASTLAPMPVAVPYGVEGYKTIAFEMILQSRPAPLDMVFVPVGGGDGLYGLYKGWREFARIGLADSIPRFVACQAAGANPVVRAFARKERQVTPLAHAWSIATSTREETAGDHALDALYGTDGFAIDVTEAEIRGAMRLLARHGIAAEAASALAIAGAEKAARAGLIPVESRVSALLTSSLIKWPRQLAEVGGRATTISSSLEELREVVMVD
ncbi:MAG: pyridoxal-phosphate dependent enzyme [Thermomicrobiales bacterium]|nr:pyridoxal-phosphate dependent enzyme [Thermomicrobiales bacterium]